MRLVTGEEKAAIREEIKRLYRSGTTSSKTISSDLKAEHGSRGTSVRTVERTLHDLRQKGEIQGIIGAPKPRFKQADKRIITIIKDTWRTTSTLQRIVWLIKRECPDLVVDATMIRQLQVEMLNAGILRDPANDERFRLTPRPGRSKKPKPLEPAEMALWKLRQKNLLLAEIIRDREEAKRAEEMKKREIAAKQQREKERSINKKSPAKLKQKRNVHRRRLKTL